MKGSMLLIAIPLLGSCTSDAPRPENGSNLSALASQIQGRTAEAPRSCIKSDYQHSLEAIDSETLAYGSGRVIYVSHLGAQCESLRSMATLIVEPSIAGQYCRGDLVRVREIGALIPGPPCIIGDWVGYRKN